MKGSACENFLTTITEMLTTDEVLTAEARQRLQEHASGCDRCHGSQDLIELAGLPATERDPVPWPDDRRFEAMRGAVQQQIESGRKRSRRGWFVVAAAGMLLVAWFGLTPRSPQEPEIRYEDLWGHDDWSEEVWAGAGAVPETESLDEDEREALWQWLEDDAEPNLDGGEV